MRIALQGVIHLCKDVFQQFRGLIHPPLSIVIDAAVLGKNNPSAVEVQIILQL